MRSKRLVGLLAGILCLALAGVAVAQTTGNTTLDIKAKPGSTKGGTKAKPQQQQKLSITITGGTKDGTGQPANSTAINTTLPSTWKINTAKWPASKRCDPAKVNAAKSDKPCPKGSKVGTGSSQAKVGNGRITQNLKLTAYVTKSKGIGFFLDGTTPANVKIMLDGKVSGNKLNVAIPKSVQEPAPGLPSGITLLKVSLNGKIKVGKGKKAKTFGLAQSTGCKGGKFDFKVDNIYRDGRLSDTDSVSCKASK